MKKHNFIKKIIMGIAGLLIIAILLFIVFGYSKDISGLIHNFSLLALIKILLGMFGGGALCNILLITILCLWIK